MPELFRLAALFTCAALCAVLLLGCGGDEDRLRCGGASACVDVRGLGVLHGVENQGVAYFKGIPYAKAPTGALRWQPPEPHGPWTSPRNASSFGSVCWQLNAAPNQSEDCLFLNVATPAAALQATSPLPVMFWIHGGGYQSGEANAYTADELVIASELSVVVVTINYRLGVFGFLASSEIKASTSDGSAGGFGVQDQRMAMAWVKDHISAFGGDGASITIFGESAGGHSVINHLTRPLSFPLYTKAIIQSGTYDEGAVSMDIAEVAYQGLKAGFGCSDLACLRGQDQFAVLLWGHNCCPGPVVDDVELSAPPTDLIAQGKHNIEVPVLMGATRDEHITTWFGMNFSIKSEAEFDIEVMR